MNASRQELADKEKKEMDLLSTYLPEVLGEVETEEIVKKIITELDITSIKEMGKAMGVIKNNHGDTVDMSLVSTFIKKLLS